MVSAGSRAAESASGDSEDYTRRFRRESALAAKLNGPNIIPIHRYGEIDGRLYIDMRLIDGVDLGALIDREGPLSPGRAVWIIEQIADAVDTATGPAWCTVT